MRLHATEESLAQIEARLEHATGAARAQVLIELAWHLRQRDTARSLKLAEEAGALMPKGDALVGRLALIRAESALFALDIERTRRCTATAMESFARHGDAIGRGDAHLFQGRVANVLGDVRAETEAAAAARAVFEGAGDELRAAHAAAADLLAVGPRDPAATRAAIERLSTAHDDPALGFQLAYMAAVLDFIEGRFAQAVETLVPVAEDAMRIGAGDLGMRAMLTLSSTFQNLGDGDEAAKVIERALTIARERGWTRWVGPALASLGRSLTYMQQPARAVEVLQEAERELARLPGSRHHAMALFYLGDAHLHNGAPEPALEIIGRSEVAARALGVQSEISANLSTMARALSRLGRHDEALAKANEALEIARKTRARLWEAEALRSLAEIHAHASPPEALARLREAIEVTATLGGHHEKSQLLVEMAAIHERSGDLAAALAAEREARVAQVAEQERRAANQLLVSRMRHEMAVLAEREASARRLASTDQLTGLANRRRFFEIAEAEIERARRYGGSIGLIMADIDHFKVVNDTHGHPAGDHVLVAVARALASRPRLNDVIARLGGEEFARLLPATDRAATLAVAERVRREVEALPLEWNGVAIAVTLSLGCVSVVPADVDAKHAAEALQKMIQAADEQLYAAKEAGRNRVKG